MPEIIRDTQKGPGFGSLRAVRGFTLIELVMVIVLLGVLAIFAAPLLNSKDFEARGFHDETLALLRYAQKTAIAQRRTVCVTFTANSATLSIASAAASANCDGALVGPRGETPARITARAGIDYNPQPGDFSFDALGQPNPARSIQIAIGAANIPQSITVEAGTGYVHD